MKRLFVVLAAAMMLVAAPAAKAEPVPAILSLTVGAAPVFGVFTPGVARDYDATTSANVISTVPEATLSVQDASGIAPLGHLVNGAFSLPQPLQARAQNASNPGTAFASVTGSPTTLLTYGGPISNDAVTLAFRQRINANDALLEGTYSKQITITLSTTTPCEMSTSVTLNVNGTGSTSSPAVTCGPLIADLIESVEALNLPSGTENNLLKKLRGAQAALDNGNTTGACDKLDAFKTAIQSGKVSKLIGAATVQALLEDTDAVQAFIGCT